MHASQVAELFRLLAYCRGHAVEAGEAQPVDLNGCLRALAKYYDRSLLDKELQKRLKALKLQLKPSVRKRGCLLP